MKVTVLSNETFKVMIGNNTIKKRFCHIWWTKCSLKLADTHTSVKLTSSRWINQLYKNHYKRLKKIGIFIKRSVNMVNVSWVIILKLLFNLSICTMRNVKSFVEDTLLGTRGHRAVRRILERAKLSVTRDIRFEVISEDPWHVYLLQNVWHVISVSAS